MNSSQRGTLTVFLVILSLVGALLVRSGVKGWQASSSLKSAPITVLESSVRVDGFDFVPFVRFTYEVGGMTHEGTRYGKEPGAFASDDAGQIQQLVDELRSPDARAWYDPASPDFATIARGESRWGRTLVGLGLILLGVGTILFLWRLPTREEIERSDEARIKAEQSYLRAASSAGAVFILISSAMFWFFTGAPLKDHWETRSFQSATAKLVSSKVESVAPQADPQNSKTRAQVEYDIWIHYEYQFEGKTYQGSGLGAAKSQYETESECQKRLDQLAAENAAGKFVIWFDADNPYRSLLDRGFPGGMWLGLLALLPLFLGLGSLGYGMRLWRE